MTQRRTELSAQHPLRKDELAKLLAINENEALSRRRAFIEQLEAQNRAEAVRSERKQRLVELQAQAPKTLLLADVIDDLVRRTREQRDRVAADAERVQLELLHDERIRNERAATEKLRARIEVEWQRWQRVADVVGSADGKKLRVYAQNVTLDMLLKHANVELRGIAPRYQLRRTQADLGLALVDLDMGGEVRGAQSLSGGETFLVSLALALGLSSLAETDLSIRTLFVDEGFGALDPDSLDMALSALESLALRGRQVGVVTHIPQVSERFSAEIEVRRAGSGESQVYVRAR